METAKTDAAAETEELARHRRRYAAAQTALSEVSTRFALADIELSTLRAELREVREELREAKEANEQLRQEHELLQADFEARENASQALEQHRAALAALDAERQRLESELAQARLEISAQQQSLRQKDAAFADVVGSPSFRIGKRITSALKRIPGLGRRRG